MKDDAAQRDAEAHVTFKQARVDGNAAGGSEREQTGCEPHKNTAKGPRATAPRLHRPRSRPQPWHRQRQHRRLRTGPSWGSTSSVVVFLAEVQQKTRPSLGAEEGARSQARDSLTREMHQFFSSRNHCAVRCVRRSLFTKSQRCEAWSSSGVKRRRPCALFVTPRPLV
jgi:hypothetical protein